jgi:hypothetical protein
MQLQLSQAGDDLLRPFDRYLKNTPRQLQLGDGRGRMIPLVECIDEAIRAQSRSNLKIKSFGFLQRGCAA